MLRNNDDQMESRFFWSGGIENESLTFTDRETVLKALDSCLVYEGSLKL